MKNKKSEIDVDFIGSQDTLTQEEKNALHQYFKKSKLKIKTKQSRTNSKKSRNKRTTT